MKIGGTIISSIQMTQFINLVVEKYTSPGEVISLTSQRMGFNFPSTRMDYNSDVIFPLNYCDRAPNFYIFDEMDIKVQLHQLAMQRSYFNPRSHYLFISTSFLPSQLRLITFHNILNSIFIDVSSGNISTYSPPKENGNMGDELKVIGQCQNDISSLLNIYPVLVLHKQAEIIIAFHETYVYSKCLLCKNPGIEIEIIQLLTRYLQIKSKFIPINEAFLEYPSEVTYDIKIGTIIMHDFSVYDQSITYVSDNLKFFVPVSQKIPKWRLVLSVFDMQAWCAFIFTLIGITLIWSFFCFTKIRPNSKVIFSSTLNFISVFFRGRTGKCRASQLSLEILYFSIIFLSFTMYIFFNTRLTFILYGIVFENRISNPVDIASNELFIGSSTNSVQHLLERIPGLENYSSKYYINCFNTDECIKLFKNNKNLTLFFPYRQIRHYITEYLTEDDRNEVIRELEQSYFTAFIVACFRKGHPLYHLFNTYLRYLVESGIIAKIVDKYSEPIVEELKLEHIQKLNYQHMIAPFSLLIVGSSLGLFIFLLEVKKFI
ncbi:hypothetical protein WA026_008622 [Henosepilachna vigintioctopunctata]|uniref:Uncharacterized protein n=1 Tax=Henosepilachna vigintioctopunctata TaxID=420089 RepID=A0AAW1U8N0_9CUCU